MSDFCIISKPGGTLGVTLGTGLGSVNTSELLLVCRWWQVLVLWDQLVGGIICLVASVLMCCCRWGGKVVMLGTDFEVIEWYLSLPLKFDRQWIFLAYWLWWVTIIWNQIFVLLGFPRHIHIHIGNNSWLVWCTSLQPNGVNKFFLWLFSNGSRTWFLVEWGVFSCNQRHQRHGHRWIVGVDIWSLEDIQHDQGLWYHSSVTNS